MKKKNITRREFVATLAAGTGFVIAGNKADAASVLNIGKSAGPLQTVSLGRTGIKTSLLGMGTGFNGGNRSSAITRAGTAETVIRYAFDRGIRLFDCADSYGTHPFVFKALKEIPREQYTLVSKIWVLRGGIPEPERPDADIVLDRFRKELNTD